MIGWRVWPTQPLAMWNADLLTGKPYQQLILVLWKDSIKKLTSTKKTCNFNCRSSQCGKRKADTAIENILIVWLGPSFWISKHFQCTLKGIPMSPSSHLYFASCSARSSYPWMPVPVQHQDRTHPSQTSPCYREVVELLKIPQAER